MNREEFAKGPIEIPGPLNGDAYTVAGEILSSDKANEKSVYGVSFRKSPKDVKDFQGVAEDDRMIFYGLADYIRKELTKPVTMEDIDNAEEFMSTAHAFGGALPFDRKVWERVVSEYDGHLPLRIEALPEGSTFYPNEIPVQVTSLDEGFGEVAALIEANMLGMVANASARATLERHMLERLIEYAKDDMPNATREEQLLAAQLMIHDFGMRASSVPEESQLLGKAHLLSFPGTDTFNAAYQAWVENGRERVGSSILALAHRTVMGWDNENGCFDNIKSAANGTIASYLTDTYNIDNALENELLPLAIESANGDGSVIVARPDSGDYIVEAIKVLDLAKENGLVEQQDNGRYKMTTLSKINGDSMDWNKLESLLETQIEHGYSTMNCGITGIGGWLRNTPNRDSLSASYKLMAMGSDLECQVKLAEALGKLSTPGPVQVLRGQRSDQPSEIMDYETPVAGTNALEVFYDGSKKGIDKYGDRCLDKFSVKQDRVINGFAAAPLEQKVWSDEIISIQDNVMAQHGRNRNDYRH